MCVLRVGVGNCSSDSNLTLIRSNNTSLITILLNQYCDLWWQIAINNCYCTLSDWPQNCVYRAIKSNFNGFIIFGLFINIHVKPKACFCSLFNFYYTVFLNNLIIHLINSRPGNCIGNLYGVIRRIATQYRSNIYLTTLSNQRGWCKIN